MERTLADITTKEEQEKVMELWRDTYGDDLDWLNGWDEYLDDIADSGCFLVWYEGDVGDWMPVDFFMTTNLEGLAARLRENSRYHVRWAWEGTRNWWE